MVCLDCFFVVWNIDCISKNSLPIDNSDIFTIKQGKKMKDWEICECDCLKYLKNNFSNAVVNFERGGGSDSTKSDILVTKNGIAIFYIESKMQQAQCGQFVAFPNLETQSFDYSKLNAYPLNLQSQLILDNMSMNFDKYRNPRTDGIELTMDNSLFYNWICEFYKLKGVKYFIIEKEVGKNDFNSNNFIIFPIEHFQQYFDVSAFYRRKKSGSSNPTEKDFPEIKKSANFEGFAIKKIYKKDKYVFVEMNAYPMTYKLVGDTHTYQFKNEKENIFKVTKLSNTSNPNVIFSISLIKNQQVRDLEKFRMEFI